MSIADAYGALEDLLTAAMTPLDVQVVAGSPAAVTTLKPDVLFVSKIVGNRSRANMPFGTSQDVYTVELTINAPPVMSAPSDSAAAVIQAGSTI